MKKSVLLFLIILLLPSLFFIIPKIKGNSNSITYDVSTNTITVIGYNESSPCSFNDLWEADKNGILQLKGSETFSGVGITTIYLTTQVRPCEWGGIRLFFNITAINGSSTYFDTYGYSSDLEDTNIQMESIHASVKGIGEHPTTRTWRQIVEIDVRRFNANDSVTFSIYQSRWGVVWKTGDTQFMFDCRTIIGDGSTTTWFKDKGVQITFNEVFSGSWQNAIYLYNFAHLILGEVVDATNKITKNGVSIINVANYGNSYLIRGQGSFYTYFEAYSCIFQSTDRSYIYYLGNAKIWHTIFTINIGLDVHGDYYDVVIANQAETALAGTGTFDNLIIEKCRYALTLRWSTEITLNNIKIRNIDNQEFYSRNRYANVYLINFDSDNWRFLFTVDSTGEWFRQYEFDLTITFQNGTLIENANVTISNDYLNITNSWLTYANGSIPQQTYNMGHYNYTGGNNIYDYNPYNLTVTYGSLTYTKIFNITEPIKWQIAIGQQTTETIEELKAIGLIIIVVSLCCCLMVIAIYGGKKKNEI